MLKLCWQWARYLYSTRLKEYPTTYGEHYAVCVVSVLFNVRLNGAKYVIPRENAEAVSRNVGDSRLATLAEVRYAFDQGYR